MMTDDSEPPSPGSYFWPLLGMIILCGAYLWYSRQKRENTSFVLRDVLKYRPLGLGSNDGVRLSIDDLPSRTEFLSNNASTDSLPEDVELPVFHAPRSVGRQQAIGHPSYQTDTFSSSSPIRSEAFMDDPGRARGKAGRLLGSGGGARSGFGRKSMRRKGPIEGDSGSEGEQSATEGDDAQEEAAGTPPTHPVFGIGDEDT